MIIGIPFTTLQDFYDRTITHLVTQGRQALGTFRRRRRNEDICRYRTPVGLSCAAGCHIPDDLYTASMEGQNIDNLLMCADIALQRFFPPQRKNTDIGTYPLHRALQRFHDNSTNWDDTGLSEIGRREAHALAREYGVTPYPF